MKSNFTIINGPSGESVEDVLARAKERAGECDGVVVLMQHKTGGVLWFAPDQMKLETMVFYLWSALRNIGQ